MSPFVAPGTQVLLGTLVPVAGVASGTVALPPATTGIQIVSGAGATNITVVGAVSGASYYNGTPPLVGNVVALVNYAVDPSVEVTVTNSASNSYVTTAPLGFATAALGQTQGGASEMQLIQSQVLGAAAPSVTFSSIPATFTNLLLKAVGRSTAATENDYWLLRLNGDTSASYYVAFFGQASSAFIGGNQNDPATGMWFQSLTGANATAGVPGTLEAEIPFYSLSTFQKAVRARCGYIDLVAAGTDSREEVCDGLWTSTSPVSAISLSLGSGANFVVGSAFALYGY